ncbi:glycerate kinase [Bradyrhizobium sp. AZCC 1719]|uniref:glycerate kinase family protein n=1 Tax=Bradyrhizobium sp. AZCC 1719 TaxID=3117028 RepID=UPI002FF1C1CA
MALTVLIAPSGFKECLSATEVAGAMAAGVRRTLPDARVLSTPMIDGGEGFTAALVAATNGTLEQVTVSGPVNAPVRAPIGFLGGSGPKTAVIEIAAAAGLRLVPRGARDPAVTTSRGVGELIRAALDAGAEHILVGCGDSGVNDGGAGMAEALGIRLLDTDDKAIGCGGGALARLASIDLSNRDPRLDSVQIEAAVNWHNVLLGEHGVTRVYGPQKGATPAQIVMLEAALGNYAACVRVATGVDVKTVAGGGASGGIGAGLHALLGAVLRPRFDMVMHYTNFDALLAETDLVLTGEGTLDNQTPFGKVPAEVARRAKARGLPVIALAGSIGEGAKANLDCGIDAFASIQMRPWTLDEAMASASHLLRHATEDTIRMVLVGMRLLDPAGCHSHRLRTVVTGLDAARSRPLISSDTVAPPTMLSGAIHLQSPQDAEHGRSCGVARSYQEPERVVLSEGIWPH